MATAVNDIAFCLIVAALIIALNVYSPNTMTKKEREEDDEDMRTW